MSLQISPYNSSNIYPTCDLSTNSIMLASQEGLYSPNKKKLDPITEQILKTKDARLEVMDCWESGLLGACWKADKKCPTSDPICDIVDRVFLWGKYHPDNRRPDSMTIEQAKANSPICFNILRGFDLCYCDKKGNVFSWDIQEDHMRPSLTWLGDKIDRIFLWGKYFQLPSEEEYENCWKLYAERRGEIRSIP